MGRKWEKQAEKIITKDVPPMLVEGSVEVFIALDGEVLAGVVAFTSPAKKIAGCDEPHIHALGVQLEYQRRGIGTNLKQRVLDTVAARGFDHVTSQVHRKNHKMLRLNEKLGVVEEKDPDDGEYRWSVAALGTVEAPPDAQAMNDRRAQPGQERGDGPPYLDVVPQLRERADDLRALSVHEVLVVEAGEGDESVWVALVLLLQEHRGSNRPLVWRLGARPSRSEAVAAVVALLEGLLDGQAKARADHPGIEPQPPSEVTSPPVVVAMDEWASRRFPVADVWMQFGQMVRQERRRARLTQAKLAEMTGVSQSQVSRLERGLWPPPAEMLDRLFQVLEPDR